MSSIVPPPLRTLQVVVVDDGSTDGTAEMVSEFKRLSKYELTYVWQENRGRASALRRAVLLATGRFLMIMDSDDSFPPNALNLIFSELDEFFGAEKDVLHLAGLVFLVQDQLGNIVGSRFPGNHMVSNLLAIYADYGVVGDKKEVIKSETVKASLYGDSDGERRVPTSLIWAKVAERYDCVFINYPIVRKRYLHGGMSYQLTHLKAANPHGMCDVHELRAFSGRYRSWSYRARSVVNFVRYSALAGRDIPLAPLVLLLAPAGLLLACVDRLTRCYRNWRTASVTSPTKLPDPAGGADHD